MKMVHLLALEVYPLKFLLQNLTKDENILSELMNEVLQVYISLQGVHPVKAEIQYMKEIQMMDGYGMEYYVAKVCFMLRCLKLWHLYYQAS